MNKSELREVQVKELSPVFILKNYLKRTNNTFDEKKLKKPMKINNTNILKIQRFSFITTEKNYEVFTETK